MNDLLSNENEVGRRPQQGGPQLVVLASISLVLLLGGIGIGVALGGVPPLPFAAVTSVKDFLVGHPVAVQVIAVGVFAASVPLAIYAATASRSEEHTSE